MKSNKISTSVKADDLTAMLASIAALNEKLPYLINLLPDERKEMLKMGDKTLAFVTKALEYAIVNPGLAGLVDVPEFEKDVKLIASLLKVLRPLQALVQRLEDTVMQAGSEAYNEALHFYGSSRIGMKSGVPGAQTIFNDLAERFPGKARKFAPTTV